MSHCITITLGGVTAEDDAIKQLVFDDYNKRNATPLGATTDVTATHLDDYFATIAERMVHRNETENATATATYTF